MKALTWINFILGLWLIVAGFTLSTAAGPVMTEEIVMGIIIACLAIVASRYPTSAISWVIAVAGLWLAIAPAAINYRGISAARANDVVVGIVVLILGIANATFRESRIRTGA
jgi:SPW repeat